MTKKERRRLCREIFAKRNFDLLDAVMKLPPGRDRNEFIASHMSEAGGFTAITLARFGVSWPPKVGWRSRIVYAPAKKTDQFAEPRLSKLMGESV